MLTNLLSLSIKLLFFEVSRAQQTSLLRVTYLCLQACIFLNKNLQDLNKLLLIVGFKTKAGFS